MLEGMTQELWSRLNDRQRKRVVDLSSLTPELKGYEGSRVEVIDQYCERRRFWVGRSNGWRPIHLEVATTRSSGGPSADRSYQSVVLVRPAR